MAAHRTDVAVGTTGTKDAVILSTGMLVALNTRVAVDGQDKTDAKAPHTS